MKKILFLALIGIALMMIFPDALANDSGNSIVSSVMNMFHSIIGKIQDLLHFFIEKISQSFATLTDTFKSQSSN